MKKLLYSLSFFALIATPTVAQTADVNQYIMYFPFDNDLNDASSQNVVLNPKIPTSVVDTYAPGQFGDAALFNDKPYITSNSIFNAGDSFSILMWVNFNSLTSSGPGTPKLMHQEDEGPTSTFLAGRPLQIATAAVTVNTSFGEAVSNSSSTPPLNTWVHIALVMDKTAQTVKLYIDGVEDTSNTIGNPIKVDNKTNSAQISVGVQKNSTTAGLLDAYIDDFVITTEVLDAATINNIITNGAAAGGLLSTDDAISDDVRLQLYRNDQNQLKVDSNISFDRYLIYNTLGQQLNSGALEQDSIEIDALSKGIYIVKLFSETTGHVLTRKVAL